MSAAADSPVIIHIAGACKGNPGPGGWGAVIARNGRTKELCGGTFWTTNSVMELTAAISALEALKKPLPVRLLTTSQYIVNGMSKFLSDWKTKGWRRADGKPLINAELWQRLEELAAVHRVEWVWMSGHTSEAGHEQAQQLASQGTRKGSQ